MGQSLSKGATPSLEVYRELQVMMILMVMVMMVMMVMTVMMVMEVLKFAGNYRWVKLMMMAKN